MKHTILALALICGNAQAEFYTGNDLLQRIDSESHGEKMLALGYVIGVFDVGQSVLHCSPSNVTAGQVRDMTASYLRNFPAKRNKTAESLINEVLTAAWPCPKKGVNL
jgi:hypothetical protein